MASSTCNISFVIWKLRIDCATFWMVYSSFCMVLSSASVTWGIGYVPLSCLYIAFIFSNTFLISTNTFLIIPLWFSASSNSSIVWSCTLSVTRLESSSVNVYFDIFLWALAFLHDPHVCIIGFLGGPISCGVVVVGVSYIIVSPLPCFSYTRELSFFHVCASFFGELPFFCVVVFWPSFACCVGFFVTTFPPTNVLDDPTSTYFTFGISLVMAGIFHSSFMSLIAISNSYALM
jgi:hypothetical protein